MMHGRKNIKVHFVVRKVSVAEFIRRTGGPPVFEITGGVDAGEELGQALEKRHSWMMLLKVHGYLKGK